ncbi:MAG: lipid-A-disaccharide synthase N-terminal domain-containing protein [Phycisphaerales bacterium]|nr:lipid-A-disaccharide synthase N-terminal domain-containing protein [Phycisphaerales bacterium]
MTEVAAKPKKKRKRRRIKWEPPVAMVALFLLGLWLVVGPEKYPDMAPLREGARVAPMRIGPAKGYIEAVEAQGAMTFRLLYRDGAATPVLTEAELGQVVPATQLARLDERLRHAGTGGHLKEVIFRLFDISSWLSLIWIAIGLGGQAAFFGRMFVQWIVSERQRSSVVPEAFWWLSLGGGVCLFAYFAWRQDIVGVLGQTSGVVIYGRNLRLIHKRKKQALREAAEA